MGGDVIEEPLEHQQAAAATDALRVHREHVHAVTEPVGEIVELGRPDAVHVVG